MTSHRENVRFFGCHVQFGRNYFVVGKQVKIVNFFLMFLAQCVSFFSTCFSLETQKNVRTLYSFFRGLKSCRKRLVGEATCGFLVYGRRLILRPDVASKLFE